MAVQCKYPLFVTFQYTICLICAKFGIRRYYSRFQRENAGTDIGICLLEFGTKCNVHKPLYESMV